MLNPQQRLAAETLDGPVLILAGAGSGKTRALTYRAANLIDHGVLPWRILCLTFTNKAAREMKNRILQLVGDTAEDAWISTFHSTCARILRRDIEKLGYARSFSIYDTDEQQSVIKEILKAMNIDEKTLPPREIAARISDAKNRMQGPDEWFRQSERNYRAQRIHEVYLAYEKRLKELNALDFDDLILRTLELFAQHPPVLQSYQERFRYVMVDEYQDTNLSQYMLVRLLTLNSRNLCVVGDDDQSIYGWRGADIRNILDFRKDYPDAMVIKLEQNYRSTANILDAANQVIAHNAERTDKRLWTETDAGDPIGLYCAGNEHGEAGWVASRIKQLYRQGVPFHQMAVLYRTNAQSRVLEDALVTSTDPKIPYRVFGGTRFYDRQEIKEILAYLRVLENPADDMALRRIINVPRRAIGSSTVDELVLHANRNGIPLYSALMDLPESLSTRPRKAIAAFVLLISKLMVKKDVLPLTDLVEAVLDESGLQAMYEAENTDEARSRVENLKEFAGAVAEFAGAHEDARLGDFLESISLVTDLDSRDDSGGYVTLMTMHSAKGLEFDTVFITGMEDGIFPSSRSVDDEERLEEERRLCYVAITRAKRHLFITRAFQRSLFNNLSMNPPSRFLEEIPKRLLQDMSFQGGRPAGGYRSAPLPPRRSAPKPVFRPGDPLSIPGVQRGFTPSPSRSLAESALPDFAEGDRVYHRKFGKGRVVRRTGEGAAARVHILFDGLQEEKVFALSVAPIIKLEDE